MNTLMLFKNFYEPKLIDFGIQNVVLRKYEHIEGFRTHSPQNSVELIFTPREEVDSRLTDVFLKNGESVGVAITSLVNTQTSQRQQYLLLVDCGCNISQQNEEYIITLIKQISVDISGFENSMLLRTLNSYHIVGFKPLSFEQWRLQMSQVSLLTMQDAMTPLADLRYIAHSLSYDYGSLRLTDYKGKPTPEFICYIN